MRYINFILLIFVVVDFGVVVYLAMTSGWWNLFILPILIIAGYTVFYLHNQIEKQEEEIQEKEVKLAIEEKDAEAWMKDTFVPQTISYGTRNRSIIILYSFLFLAGVYFLWSFVGYGLEIALRDVILAGVLFWLIVLYFWGFGRLGNFGRLRKLGDWGRAYVFLLPVSYLIYIIYPVEDLRKIFMSKIGSFPVFFLTYTFSFLCLYCIIYIYKEMHKDEEKKLEKEVKDLF